MTQAPRPLIFLWNNYGPMHADRVQAVAERFPRREVIGIELYSTDVTYDWVSEGRDSFEKVTLFGDQLSTPRLAVLRRLLREAWARRHAEWFLCHYERPEIFALSIALRFFGARSFAMGCSKFDDMERFACKEWAKTLFLRPYHGAIGSKVRSVAYFRFLGFNKRPVAAPYNTLSLERMRQQAGIKGVRSEAPLEERDWIIVARLVPKKNLAVALDAYAHYRAMGGEKPLHICGNGPLEAELKAQAVTLGIADHVIFHGFVQSEEISRLLARSRALILPSIEEQFGNVVVEAQALGLPVLISTACGASEALITSWKNGFIFEADNPEGQAHLMRLIDNDPALWQRLCDGAVESAPLHDVAAFAEAVAALVAEPRERTPS